MKKYVLFDMDGVLVDTEPVHMEIMQEVFAKMGKEITKEYQYQLVGMGALLIWQKLKVDFNLEGNPEDLLQSHKNYFFEVIENKTITMVPGVVDLLENLKQHQYPISLGSSSPVKLIELFTQKTNIAPYFDYKVSSEHVKNGKPFPDIFLHVAELYNVAPEHFVVIEDSKNGTLAAKAAGMKCIGFKSENSGNQDLSAADFIVDDMKDITLNLIDSL
ncbi:HAD family hydrolase [Zhouia sp. PK063]|uniref:HAD family hydrolase n=1 Tax=Zhouia sp. PK063 TaxID=3373602 RepID=UPI0037AC7DF5